jgi:hypothetical protein
MSLDRDIRRMTKKISYIIRLPMVAILLRDQEINLRNMRLGGEPSRLNFLLFFSNKYDFDLFKFIT